MEAHGAATGVPGDGFEGDRLAEPIKVLVVDDQELFRRGLAMLLDAEDDITVVAEAADGASAVDLAAETLPDVVLMGVQMPRRGGMEACAALKQVVPSTRIVMLTPSDDEADLYESVRAGASGYLLKDVSIEEVSAAVRVVADGQSLINPSMAAKLLTEFAAMAPDAETASPVAVPRLTDRETEVLRLVARGRDNREIARELFISDTTVNNHVRNVIDKLQQHSRMEAVVQAVKERLPDRPEGDRRG